MQVALHIFFGFVLGTWGLALMHHAVHKYRLWNMSICWKHHLMHHSKKHDTEHFQRQKYNMIEFAFIRIFNYIKNPKEWGYGDIGMLALCLIYPYMFITVFMTVFVAENIAFIQHDKDGNAIDFTNKFDNYIGLNCGDHAKHHGHPQVLSTNTLVWFGFALIYSWWIIVTITKVFKNINYSVEINKSQDIFINPSNFIKFCKEL